ncbi:MAG: cbb3-type cytochrome oxidase assembly protein CcoS [Helicobacteraceae bacterium]|nr:cbb3-type cytochrome oxidase assembly protein CcoS [Helicobacteraceae bacterium]
MDSSVIAMMIGVSTFLGAIALLAFLFAVKNGHFDDSKKMMNSVHFDDEEALNDAVEKEKKREKLKEKNYRPE